MKLFLIRKTTKAQKTLVSKRNVTIKLNYMNMQTSNTVGIFMFSVSIRPIRVKH